jgi:hypothetical protein
MVLLLSYGYLSFEYKTLFLFTVKVHESGKYTLLQTILYFDHFVREIPVAAMNALSVSLSFYLFTPLAGISSSLQRRSFQITFLLVLFFLIIVSSGAINKTGFQGFILDLFQFRTRDDEIVYGSHWHSHFFDMIFVFLASLSVAFLIRLITGICNIKMNSYGRYLLVLWPAVFVLLTFIFQPDLKPFQDTRYIAHQFREIVTHSTVTIPLAFAGMVSLEKKFLPESFSLKRCKKYNTAGLMLLLLTLMIPLFMVIRLSGRDILAAAQKKASYLNLLTSHYFEHSLDYFFVPALSIFIFLGIVLISQREHD